MDSKTILFSGNYYFQILYSATNYKMTTAKILFLELISKAINYEKMVSIINAHSGNTYGAG